MVECYKKKYSPNVNLSYDSVAIAVRNAEFVAVIYERNGELQVAWYPEFLSSPFFTELVLRKFHIKTDEEEFKKLFHKRLLILQHQVKTKDSFVK